jgi:Ser/Thr protein kinase RdoA (MazF antagonist)
MLDEHAQPLMLLAQLLHDAYAAQPRSFTRLSGNEIDKLVFRAALPGGDTWIVRMYTPENTRSNVPGTAAVLAALESAEYPAERLIHTCEGAAFVADAGWRVLVTRAIDGAALDDNLGTLQRVGALLGRLHALFRDSPLLPTLPLAERTIEDEIRMSLEDLDRAAPLLPADLRPLHHALYQACTTISPWSELPQVLIHNDFHLDNLLQRPGGELLVIDWDGAGRSPAILDVGFLHSSCHPKHSPRPDPARIDALVAGYCRYHQLSRPELDGLFDAVRFRLLAFLTYDLAQKVLQPERRLGGADWWEARYAASAETAVLARASFERWLG